MLLEFLLLHSYVEKESILVDKLKLTKLNSIKSGMVTHFIKFLFSYFLYFL